MSLQFYPVRTQDGSIGLFNEEVDDIYHSSYGAYNESLEKFINPCGLVNHLSEKKHLKILDICFGMGYNSKSAISKILENNFEGEFIIDALEMDPYVVAFSLICEKEPFLFDFLDFVDFSIFSEQKIVNAIFELIDNEKFTEFLDAKKVDLFKINKKDIYKGIEQGKITTLLHNIYYKYISTRNIEKDKTTKYRPKISLRVRLGDARNALFELEGKYDYIFLDAFTPTKLPTLWSVEFFAKLKTLLNSDGNLTTYSNSAAVRNGMIEAGFFVGKTSQGTIATLLPTFIENHLDEKSLGLMETKAGIPFYDENLNSTKEEILGFRKNIIDASGKKSSSQFLKNYQNKK